MSEQDTDNTAQAAQVAALGFPSPLLGQDNLRLRVLYNKDGLFALERPARVLNGPHPWHVNLPNIADAINEQLRNDKPEMLRLGLDPKNPVQAIFHTDPGIAGVALFASGAEATAKARNAFGSSIWRLRFEIVATGGPAEDEAECDLPVARHNNLPVALVSITTGKKTSTRFRRLERLGKFNIWEAETNYYRADQLPVHAVELGIRICGEGRYAHESPVFMSRLKRGWTGDREFELPLYEAPSAYLAELTLEDGTSIKADPPKKLANQIKQIRKRFGQ
ncbi:MAG: hypothetical protein WC360_03815 [Opitutales bacterium]|jgi:23S rRNA-/tRNA-specific pseudouridylate synthase